MPQFVNQNVRSGAESYRIFENFQPLRSREIRLIHLLPGGILNLNPLSCKIVHQLLDGTAQFEALSYCWGDAKPTGKIICDGQEFMITDSLETAFHRIRYRDRLRIIWADFLCINQTDFTEKSSQVLLMTDIYRQAANVMAWVGQSTSEDSDAMKIEKLLRRVKTNEYADAAAWRTMIAFTKFFQRPWFGRMWIIQELGVARRLTLYCGKYEMDWEIFRRGVDLLLDRFGFYLNTSNTDAALERILTMLSIRNLVTEHSEQQQQTVGLFRQLQVDRLDQHRNNIVVQKGDLLRFARSSRPFGASDPRDRIYALLGLAEPAESQSVKVLYDKDCRQVFIDFVRATVLQTGSLDILCQAGIHENDLPSWVADWTRPLEAHSLNVDFYTADRSLTDLEETAEPDILKISGYIVDTISILHPGFTSDSAQETWKPKDGSPQLPWRPGTAPADTPAVFEKTMNGSLGMLLPMAEIFENPLKMPFLIPEMASGAVKGLRAAREPRTARIKPELEQSWHECAQNCRRYGDSNEAYEQTLLGGMPFRALGPALTTLHRDVCYRIWRERLSKNPLVERGFVHLFTPKSGPKVELPKELKTMYFNATKSKAPLGPGWKQEAKQFIARAFSREVDRISLNRQFCATKSGFMGWVPAKAQIGDLVCVLKGGKVPFVLRSTDIAGEYRLVGEAYVHGLMTGESILNEAHVRREIRLR